MPDFVPPNAPIEVDVGVIEIALRQALLRMVASLFAGLFVVSLFVILPLALSLPLAATVGIGGFGCLIAASLASPDR